MLKEESNSENFKDTYNPAESLALVVLGFARHVSAPLDTSFTKIQVLDLPLLRGAILALHSLIFSKTLSPTIHFETRHSSETNLGVTFKLTGSETVVYYDGIVSNVIVGAVVIIEHLLLQ